VHDSGISHDANMQDTAMERSCRNAQHVPEVCASKNAEAALDRSQHEAKAADEPAQHVSPGSKADQCKVQSNAQHLLVQSTHADAGRASTPEQQSVQVGTKDNIQKAQNSAPAQPVEQLCPYLNSCLFTQAGASQSPCAGLAQTEADQAMNVSNARGENYAEEMAAGVSNNLASEEAALQMAVSPALQESPPAGSALANPPTSTIEGQSVQPGFAEPVSLEPGLQAVIEEDLGQLRENANSAEAARHAGLPIDLARTARKEEEPFALSPMPRVGLEQRVTLCLQLETQIEAEVEAADHFDTAAEVPCITVLPDTMEPCSNTKATPKSKQRTVQGNQACDHVQGAEQQQGTIEGQEEGAQGVKTLPSSNAQPALHEGAPTVPLQNPARRWVTCVRCIIKCILHHLFLTSRLLLTMNSGRWKAVGDALLQ